MSFVKSISLEELDPAGKAWPEERAEATYNVDDAHDWDKQAYRLHTYDEIMRNIPMSRKNRNLKPDPQSAVSDGGDITNSRVRRSASRAEACFLSGQHTHPSIVNISTDRMEEAVASFTVLDLADV